jgi:hypothetical protein
MRRYISFRDWRLSETATRDFVNEKLADAQNRKNPDASFRALARELPEVFGPPKSAAPQTTAEGNVFSHEKLQFSG